MLVLTRKVGEEIQIGNNIVIRVIRQQGNRIQLGVIAPSDISIRRVDWTSLPQSDVPPQQPEQTVSSTSDAETNPVS